LVRNKILYILLFFIALSVNDYADVFNVLKDQCPSYAAIKSEGGEDIGGRRSGRSISVSTPRNIDVTHDMIVKDQIKLRHFEHIV
jgi:hypothetical protein